MDDVGSFDWRELFRRAFFNVRVWQRLCVVLALFTMLLITVMRGQDQLAKGFYTGREQGNLEATAAYLDSIGKQSPPQIVDLQPTEAVLTQMRTEIGAKSERAAILVFIDTLLAKIKLYESAVKENKLDFARSTLTGQIAPSSRAMKTVLAEVRTKLDTEVKEKQTIWLMTRILTYVFVPLGFISLIALLGSSVSVSSRHSYLQQHLIWTFIPTIVSYCIFKAGLTSDEERRKRLGKLIFLSIETPDVDDLAKGKKDILGRQSDLRDELERVEAYAYLISEEKSVFELPPAGTCYLDYSTGALAHALVQWMSEIAKDQEIKHFDLETRWDGEAWVVNLHTTGSEVHETVAAAYGAALDSNKRLGGKHNSVLDFVRTVLRRFTKTYSVTHENENLNLVLTFTPP